MQIAAVSSILATTAHVHAVIVGYPSREKASIVDVEVE
jgi:hypothetical protein